MNGHSPSEERRVALAEAIASSWAARSLRYAVVHGLERYPARIGRDLDVAIGRESVDPAVEAAVACARDRGFRTVFFRWSHWGLYQLALVDREESTALALDLLCTTDVWRAKWVQLVDRPQFDRIAAGDDQLGPFRISEEGRFLKSCVRPLLCGDLSRFGAGREWSLPVTPQPIDRDRLQELLGGAATSALATVTSTGELEAVLPAGPRRLQARWARSHPFAAARSLREAVTGRVRRRFLDPAACVFVSSPEPEVVLEAARELTGEAAQVFVDLRPAAMPATRLQRMAAEVRDWRVPPVSEFVVTVVVGRSSPVGPLRRLFPTTGLALPGGLSRLEARAALRERILDFLTGTYSPPAFRLRRLDAATPLAAPVRRLERTRA